MMYKKIMIAVFAAQLLLSCAEKNEQKQTTEPMQEQTNKVKEEKNLYKDVVFDSKKDFVCGMPVSAGVSDTAHYQNKVYGFCSKECKDEFVKNPTNYITAK